MGGILYNLPVYVGVQVDTVHKSFDVDLRLLVSGQSLLYIGTLYHQFRVAFFIVPWV